MLDSDNCIGRVVYSKAGRDKGKFFVILRVLNDKYVYISDGVLRNVKRPKKKKIKHLGSTDCTAEEIKSLLISGKEITNEAIRKILQSYDNNKEV